MIQGEDDREHISKTDSEIQKLSLSVAQFLDKEQVIQNDDGTYSVEAYDLDNALCSDEKFHRELSFGGCTGAKINEELVATAAHCVKDVKKFCDDKLLVFGFNDQNVNQGFYSAEVKKHQVLKCKGVVYHSRKDDVALLLIEPNQEIPSIKVSSQEVKPNDPLFIIGHGSGYLAHSSSGKVTATDKIDYFEGTLDVFGGDSGAPVFNAETKEMVGILIRGDKGQDNDRTWDSYSRCERTPKTKNEKIGLSEVAKASTTLVPAILSLYKMDLVDEVLKNPSISGIEKIKDEIDPNLRFTILSSTTGTPFFYTLFYDNLSIKLFNDLNKYIPRDQLHDLLWMAQYFKNTEFAEAIYDKFYKAETEYDFKAASRMLEVFPETRYRAEFEKYDLSELIEIAIVLYERRSPMIFNLLDYREEIFLSTSGISGSGKDGLSIRLQKNSVKYTDLESLKFIDDEARTQLDLDYLLLKRHFKITDEMSDEQVEVSVNYPGLGSYFYLLHLDKKKG